MLSSVRTTARVTDTQRLISEIPEIVPKAVVARAFGKMDMDGDGMVSNEDLRKFVKQNDVADINGAMLDQMVEESACMRSIGGLKSDEGRKQFMDRLTLQDVQGAVGFRRLQATQRATKTLGRSRRKEWQARAFQHFWLLLIEAALPGEPILASSVMDLFTVPIRTEREKNEARGAGGDGQNDNASVGSVRSGFRSVGMTTVASMSVGPDGGPRKPRRQTYRGDEARKKLTHSVRHKRPRNKADGAIVPGKESDFHGTRGLAMAAMALTKKVVEPQHDTGVAPVLRIGFDAENEQRKIELSLLATSQGAARSAAVREKLAEDKVAALRESKKKKPDFNRTFHRKTTEADWTKKQQAISRATQEDNKGWSNKATAFEDNMRKNDILERAEVRASGKSDWSGFFHLETCQTLQRRVGLDQKGFHGASAQGLFNGATERPYIHTFRDEVPERFLDKKQLTSAGMFRILQRPLKGVQSHELVKIIDPNDGFNWVYVYKQGGPAVDNITTSGKNARESFMCGPWRGPLY
jgi:hypothetical protein